MPLFFVLSKTVGILLLPTNLLICWGSLASLCWAPGGQGSAAGCWSPRCCCWRSAGFSPLGSWLLLPLEVRFPAWDAARGAPDGIVVLGGAIDADVSAAHGVPVLGGAADRIVAGAALAHQYPSARLVFTGGSSNLIGNDPREADYAAELFKRLGVPSEQLTIERRSRNTEENAEFTKGIAAPKDSERWLLVTSAYHMPRSVGLFRKAGFRVEPYPVDWRIGPRADLRWFSPIAAEGLQRTELAVHEWLGLFAYWLTGKTRRFLPGPEPE